MFRSRVTIVYLNYQKSQSTNGLYLYHRYYKNGLETPNTNVLWWRHRPGPRLASLENGYNLVIHSSLFYYNFFIISWIQLWFNPDIVDIFCITHKYFLLDETIVSERSQLEKECRVRKITCVLFSENLRYIKKFNEPYIVEHIVLRVFELLIKSHNLVWCRTSPR